MELSVVIPAYREAEALALLLPALEPQVAGLTDRWEILIVDSMEALDETAGVCASHQVRHIRRRGGNSYGDAVRTGIAEAAGSRILFMDADGSHNPHQLQLLWAQRGNGDVVIGSRYVTGGMTENPPILILLSWIVNVSYRVVFGLKIKDVSNSFRLYQGDLLRSLRLQCRDFDIIEEILIKICSQRGHSAIREVPISFETRKKGKSKRNLLLFSATYLSTMVRLFRLRK